MNDKDEIILLRGLLGRARERLSFSPLRGRDYLIEEIDDVLSRGLIRRSGTPTSDTSDTATA
jgi:hypothetical protein